MRASVIAVLAATGFGDAIAAFSALVKRDSVPDQVICKIPNFNNDTNDDLLSSQINALRDSRRITLGTKAGGGWCTRLTCESGSDGDVGIYACNDASKNVTIDGSTVADFAEAILNTTACTSQSRQGNTPSLVQGQAFNNTAGWNVILGMADGDSC